MPFIHLCCVLSRSRRDWHKNPRPPSEVNEHCAMAKRIVVFMEVVGDDGWWRVGRLFFALPESDEDDESEEEKEMMVEKEEEMVIDKEEEEAMEDDQPEVTANPTIAAPASEVGHSDDGDINMTDVGVAFEKDLAQEETMDGDEMMEMD
ncbi:uncharacterized protein GGS22DRAFT_172462 [Annulohypoxylon maeteangense]|uniref:uncharacterized protein n=1 Tax=Annulohypoxylon maeteangense TaxID=1927788 RepID=UPI002007E40B|nr:uncharacterized protein GGS22DRAFT_172462 [Annulohypoxylon maeteangense]KAI0881556.1 hypothetical protein GGS22DRAFT_172462 [Annulohypoxylon maeteangense]